MYIIIHLNAVHNIGCTKVCIFNKDNGKTNFVKYPNIFH